MSICTTEWRIISFNALLTVGLTVSGVGCNSDVPSSDHEEVSTPTPPPGPNIDKTTWCDPLYEVNNDLVQADTLLFYNIDSQQGTVLKGLVYHLDGTLVLDGYEAPTGVGWEVNGTYGPNAHVVLDSEFYGHTLHFEGDLDTAYNLLKGTLDLDNGAYTKYAIFGSYPYNPPNE
jgi:hypothetical protein